MYSHFPLQYMKYVNKCAFYRGAPLLICSHCITSIQNVEELKNRFILTFRILFHILIQ